MDYVPILNCQKGDTQCVLVGPPQSVDMHWDKEEKRTQICPGDRCPWCLKEQSPRGYFYAPCVTVKMCEDHQEWAKAIVQLPMGFVAKMGEKLVAGRRVSVKGLRLDGKTPLWEDRGLIESPCDTFDAIEVLARIKGVRKPVANEQVLKFRRQA